jgi:hypothetical protein
MRSHVRTEEGARRIIEHCLPRADAFLVKKENKKGEPTLTQKIEPLTVAQVQDYVKVNGIGRLLGLAWVLADLEDTSLMTPPPGL